MGVQLKLDARLAAIHGAEYPHFSEGEMARRRSALARVMEEAGVDHLLMCGEQRVRIMGSMGYAKCRKLEAAFGALVDLNRQYVRLRLHGAERGLFRLG